MILVTVGAQMPFDRLIQAVDVWAKDHPSEEVIAQIGPGGWRPEKIPFVEFLAPLEFRRLVNKAKVVVSHAGMGTILTAMENGTPLLIMPRRGDLQETRNDHQIATARQLGNLGRATVAYDANQLMWELSRMAQASRQETSHCISNQASPELLAALRAFVLDQDAGLDQPSIASDAQGAGNDATGADAKGATAHRGPEGLTSGRRCLHKSVAPDGIAAVVLLAGGTGSASLARAAERSVLELPIAQDETVFSHWRNELETAFAHRMPEFPAEVRILGGPLLQFDARNASGPIKIEHDHDYGELRGTGGLLHDVAAEYPDDAYIIVAGASTLLFEPLGELIDELLGANSEAAFFVHEDGSSPNLMLIRARCLRSISPVGFVDFKEQALPQIASANSVSVIRKYGHVTSTVRTAAEYIRAVRQYHCRRRARWEESCENHEHAFTERWRPVFAIVEHDAEVEAHAKVSDSVVLKGAHIGRGAEVAQSVVCSGAIVPALATVVNQVVRPQSAKAIATALGVRR